MAIIVQHLKYETKFGLEIHHIEKLYEIHVLVYVPKQLITLMCTAPCIVVINQEKEPTRCYLVFYYTYERLDMFRAPLCPSSGAHDYTSDYHMDHLILKLLMVGG
jgi:hypothetical protein